MREPPPLPRGLLDMTRFVAVGSVLWAVGAVVLLGVALAGLRPLDIWFTTCVAGTVLGAIGYGIFSWQRAAARRGSRLAQQGVEPGPRSAGPAADDRT